MQVDSCSAVLMIQTSSTPPPRDCAVVGENAVRTLVATATESVDYIAATIHIGFHEIAANITVERGGGDLHAALVSRGEREAYDGIAEFTTTGIKLNSTIHYTNLSEAVPCHPLVFI